MTIIVLRWELICLLAANAAQAAAPVPTMPWTPPTHVLSPDKLSPLLQEWDEAVASDNFRDLEDVLGKVTGSVPEDMRYAGRYFLLYSNPEIRDRVIALYFNEVSRREAGQLFPGLSGEGYAEFTIFLATIAESTFDPRIYETVLLARLTGDFRQLYLATVNAERTLDLLSEANPYKVSPDYFEHSEFKGMLVDGAFEILSLMTAQSPEALRAKRSQMLSFVAKYAKYFAMPHKLSYTPKPVYLRWSDYRVRSAALNIAGFLGTAAEVSLVEEIIHDAPKVDFEKSIRNGNIRMRKRKDREQIREKGRRIIAQIQGRSPSGR